jgi:hypothetical protein
MNATPPAATPPAATPPQGVPQPAPKGDTATRVAFSFLTGLLLAIVIPSLFFGLPVFVKEYMALFIFLVVPMIGYITSFCFFCLIQFLQCGKVAFGQVAAVSSLTPAMTILLGGLAYYLPFLGSPVHSIIPSTPDPDETAMIQRIGGHSFYIFWAGMYAMTIGSGLIAACP